MRQCGPIMEQQNIMDVGQKETKKYQSLLFIARYDTEFLNRLVFRAGNTPTASL